VAKLTLILFSRFLGRTTGLCGKVNAYSILPIPQENYRTM
jgi:hypothetical protein